MALLKGKVRKFLPGIKYRSGSGHLLRRNDQTKIAGYQAGGAKGLGSNGLELSSNNCGKLTGSIR